ncbi:MAG: hypothetical protein WBN13_04860 [Robiginitalea sp.]|uniref:hypothetical protein n=1 Tax=Robiginitalea sp. TaxID=1902411 RepID=UPI003C792404
MKLTSLSEILFSIFLLFALSPELRAQEESSTLTDVESEMEEEFEEEEEEEESRHYFSVMVAHDHVKQGLKNGEQTWLSLPSFMLAYNYIINERFAVGIAGDIILEEFNVEANKVDEVLERSYPIALVATGTYRVINHLGILAGGGFEYAKEETFGLVRFGLEPYLKISNHLELVLNLTYDIKIDAYDNWNLGFCVAIGL